MSIDATVNRLFKPLGAGLISPYMIASANWMYNRLQQPNSGESNEQIRNFNAVRISHLGGTMISAAYLLSILGKYTVDLAASTPGDDFDFLPIYTFGAFLTGNTISLSVEVGKKFYQTIRNYTKTT